MKLVWELLDVDLNETSPYVAILKKRNQSKSDTFVLSVRITSRGDYFSNLSPDFSFLKAPSVGAYDAFNYIRRIYPYYMNMDSKEVDRKLLEYACNKIRSNIIEQISAISKLIS